jgi:hypothetical protein
MNSKFSTKSSYTDIAVLRQKATKNEFEDMLQRNRGNRYGQVLEVTHLNDIFIDSGSRL